MTFKTFITALFMTVAVAAPVAAASPPGAKNIVLVHGAFVDGSGWRGVYDVLTKRGYKVTVVQNPTTSLADDVAATKKVLSEQDGPTILVGHSYGGVVITEAGEDQRVAALVYVSAFVPDRGESAASLSADQPAGTQAPPILPPINGAVTLDRTKFAEAFAADAQPALAAFMADGQLPFHLEALTATVTKPAWRDTVY